jgi:hypothetical protein
VRDRLDYTFEDMGEQQVKNIARSVRVYRVRDRAIPLGHPVPPPPSFCHCPTSRPLRYCRSST